MKAVVVTGQAAGTAGVRLAERPRPEAAGIGVLVEGYGTARLSVGRRVFGLTDWTRDGTLAECAAVEARGEVVQRVRAARQRTVTGNVATLDDAVAAFNATERVRGITVIRVRP
ncbi:hypothetical protein [Actinacidiphila glaucinigra]|uniref:hypothetical protein n=1 Tax=Actinacidiphila glaucinigra TaxID=235986 RepID=UPI003F54954C